jgi:hypothetical protein
MEKKKLFIGNYKVILDIKRGLNKEKIMEKHFLNNTEYSFFYYMAINNLFLRKKGLQKFDTEVVKESGFGVKNEPYYTEEEMIQGIPNYQWKDLSLKEKEFYFKYTKLMKSDWTDEEIKTVENYYHFSDCETKTDTWIYVKEMIDQSGLNYPKRNPDTYRTKMQKVWRTRKNINNDNYE